MADGAYFVGRHELLAWINSTLALNITKVDQVDNGAPWPVLHSSIQATGRH